MFSLIKSFYNFIIKKITPLEIQARKEGVIIGEGCSVYSHFWGTEPYLIKIGNHCQITGGVKILTHGGGHVLRKECPDFDVFGKVVIGDWVYVGFNTLIMPGVTIGNNVLVAAGSVVTKSIPSNVIVGGNPARIISSVQKYRQQNEKYNMNSKNLNSKEKKLLLLSVDDSRFVEKEFLKVL